MMNCLICESEGAIEMERTDKAVIVQCPGECSIYQVTLSVEVEIHNGVHSLETRKRALQRAREQSLSEGLPEVSTYSFQLRS